MQFGVNYTRLQMIMRSIRQPAAKRCWIIINEHQIELLITDILMPEKDGIEIVMETLKKHPSIKIITMSGGGQIEADFYLEMTKSLGISHTLGKPFGTDELLSTIRELLEV